MFLDVPINIAPSIVAPDLEVPGINASTWNTPIISAVLKVISFRELIFDSFPLFLFY